MELFFFELAFMLCFYFCLGLWFLSFQFIYSFIFIFLQITWTYFKFFVVETSFSLIFLE